MAKISFKLSFCVIIALMLVNVGLCNQRVKQVVCIGDDITKGVWREEMIGNGTRWTDVLASYDRNIDVINAGISGLEAGNVQYLNGVLEKYPNASMYLIYLGLNDLKKIHNVDSGAAASIGAKVLRMVKTINTRVPEAEVVIVAPQRVNEEKLSSEYLEQGLGYQTPVLSDLLSASLEVVSSKTGARFIDLLNRITPEMLPDGVNPNIEGHSKIAEMVWNEISNPHNMSNEIKSIAMAPPPVGSPVSDEIATKAVVKGVTEDIKDFPRIGSSVEEPASLAIKSRGRSKKYIDKNLIEGIISKPAYELGQSVAMNLVKTVESSLVGSVDAIMEAQLSGLDMGEGDEGNTVQIAYKIPQESSVESYITGINGEDTKYEVLAEVVDWDSVNLHATASKTSTNNLNNGTDTKVINADEGVKFISESIDELAKGDVVEDSNEIVELWLPEFDVLDGLEKAVEVSGYNSIAKAGQMAEKINNKEVAEVFAAVEPIEYTGYAVFIHTGVNE